MRLAKLGHVVVEQADFEMEDEARGAEFWVDAVEFQSILLWCLKTIFTVKNYRPCKCVVCM